MKKSIPKIKHSWDLQPKAAVALQEQLAPGVISKSAMAADAVKTVAGVDAHYRRGLAFAAVVLLTLPGLEIIERKTAAKPANFPYIPGLLSFREGPAILQALDKLESAPDLLIFDGHGVAHPRRFGIASHIGLLVEIASIGCAKNSLVGRYADPDLNKGSFSYLTERDEVIGAVVRTRTRVKPVFVSIGHLVDLPDSIELVLKCCQGCRLPEPVRKADRLSREYFRVSG